MFIQNFTLETYELITLLWILWDFQVYYWQSFVLTQYFLDVWFFCKYFGLQVYRFTIATFFFISFNLLYKCDGLQVYMFTGLQLKHVLISEHRELQVYWFTFEEPFFIYLYKMSYLKLIVSSEKLWFTGLQVYSWHILLFIS